MAWAPASSQIFRSFPEGIGLEAGGGHNQLKWHVNAIHPSAAGDFNRQEFSLTPIVRLTYGIYPESFFRIYPFVGYNRFGGRSAEMSYGYKDEFWIDAVELGLIGTYVVDDYEFGVGVKHNRHIKMIQRYYGTAGQGSNRSWQEQEETIFFRNYSSDVGIKLTRNLSHWSISGESWFGISHIDTEFVNELVDIYENHFRILIGYRL